ncbi:MAG TPA: amidohydrolase family protein [Bryobacteraceae bacterium]|jgi:predicted TIM-barrel fold metal-dependent hydrolase|nr:amidohydrolase family protein [Bryobacteraceae bacterium]
MSDGPSHLSRRAFLGAAAMSTLAAADYRIIDPHVHVWKHDPEFPFAKEAHPPARDAAPETLLELMKVNGVSKTVIIQVIHYRYDNRFLASVLKHYPGTFQGVSRVDPLDPAAPDHLSQLTEQGFRGVRLSPSGDAQGDWIRGPLMPPLWKRCEQLKVPMTVLAPIGRMPELAALIERCPDLTVVIDHMADCPVDQPKELDKLIALHRYPKVFVKVSHTWSLSKQPYPWLDAQEHVKRLHASFGPQRLMWATDWPIIENSKARYDQALTVVRDDMKFLNAEDKSWMLSKTIERVWPFPA